MEKLHGSFLVALLSCAALLATGERTDGQVQPPNTQIVCDGLACGGSGGSLGCDYVYRVKPNGSQVTRIDVSVEDGDPSHYTYFGPVDWSMNIVQVARAHDVKPTDHVSVTGKAGTCPYVLRFTGPQRALNFQVGYDYFQPGARFHDAHWKSSDGAQTAWTFPVGTNYGPVHSPLRLNVLLIVLDDVGTDKLELFDYVHAPQHEFAAVPTLESLATSGIQFTNFYANPACSTTRACMQTGRYSFRHGVGEVADDYALPDCEVTLAELLKQGFTTPEQAYGCGAFGKWHLTPNVQWPVFQEHCVRNGYDRFFGALSNTSDHYNWTKVEHNAGGSAQDFPIINKWSADVVRTDAVTWIQSATEPFFAYVCFNPPHALFQAPPLQTQDGRDLLSVGTQQALALAAPNDYELFYRAMLEAVDSEIGYLLDDIGASKLNKTMVFVASDNGTPPGNPPTIVQSPHASDHGKKTIYQLGVRVPMIVSGPLATHGVCDAAVGAVDLWSTIAAITGADPALVASQPCDDATLDSLSFLALLENPAGAALRPAFCQQFTPNGIVDDAGDFDCLVEHARAVTDGTYKYVRKLLDAPNCGPCTNPCGYEEEFYYLITDPDETADLYPPSPALQTIFDDLSDYMDTLSEL